MSADKSTPADTLFRPPMSFGGSAILVPLIIGGALIVSAVILWHAHNRKARIAEATHTEEKIRHELRDAYLELRSLRPTAALERCDMARALIKKLPANLAPDYAELKTGLVLIEGESLFMLDCGAHAEQAEKLFDEALSLMQYASGDARQLAMLGRARARYESKRYQEALSDLDAVMDRNTSFGAAYYWRSLTRKQLGDEEGAKKDELRARALDSWPPLRDYMQAACTWTRDILSKPDSCSGDDARGGLMELFVVDPGERDANAPLKK